MRQRPLSVAGFARIQFVATSMKPVIFPTFLLRTPNFLFFARHSQEHAGHLRCGNDPCR
jgi:hypothetical protein